MNDQTDNGLMIQDFLNLLKWRKENQQTQHLEVHDNGTALLINNDGIIVRTFKNYLEMVRYIKQSIDRSKSNLGLA